MQKNTFVHDSRPGYPLRFTVSQYIPVIAQDEGLTLIFFHATGLHKETWEPLLEDLFEGIQSCSNGLRIQDAWAIELPNHGQSAVLNEKELSAEYLNRWDGYEYPRAAYAFLTSTSHGVDFQKRRLVGVGHSVGGNTLMLLQTLEPKLSFEGLILLDATVGPTSPEKDQMNRILTQIAWTKKDVWHSRSAAQKEFSSQPGYKNWDPRVMKLYIENGLRLHPASQYPDPFTFRGVTLACSKAQEAACYRADDHHPAAFQSFEDCVETNKVPIHLILSKSDEFGATNLKNIQVEAVQKTSRGTVQWIPTGGHMFVQAVPTLAARAIQSALREVVKGQAAAHL